MLNAQAVLNNAAGRTSVGLCPEGEMVRYVALKGRERTNPGSETHFVNSNSGEKCIEACDDDELIACESLVLTPSGCELSTTRASHANAGDLNPARNSTYLEKICVPSVLAEGTEKIWPAVENYILVGHVLEVTDAPSFAECLIACLHSEQDFGFLCKSAM
uniref:Apple domain-containing protein n=1 Tax=Parascaris equorum TaxID=6256 RepID=A0A914RCD7_PAREQ